MLRDRKPVVWLATGAVDQYFGAALSAIGRQARGRVLVHDHAHPDLRHYTLRDYGNRAVYRLPAHG